MTDDAARAYANVPVAIPEDPPLMDELTFTVCTTVLAVDRAVERMDELWNATS
jgi:hypothetical protein